MTQEEKTVYKCDHCKRKMFVASACLKHEEACTKNPKNFMSCIDCAHCIPVSKTFWDEYRDRDRDAQGFKCEKLNVGMYPIKARKFAKIYPENFDEEIEMPTRCVHYEKSRFY